MLNNKYLQIVGGFFALTLGILQGIDWLFKKYEIDNYYFNLILIAIFIVLVVGLIYYFYSLKLKTNKKSYSIIDVAKLFDSKVKYLPRRAGERYASALTNKNLSNKIYKYFGKVSLKKYIKDFTKNNQ